MSIGRALEHKEKQLKIYENRLKQASSEEEIKKIAEKMDMVKEDIEKLRGSIKKTKKKKKEIEFNNIF